MKETNQKLVSEAILEVVLGDATGVLAAEWRQRLTRRRIWALNDGYSSGSFPSEPGSNGNNKCLCGLVRSSSTLRCFLCYGYYVVWVRMD